ncbi:hypothetical protein BJX70DRAFT_397823 [Aspergillus crustosus]
MVDSFSSNKGSSRGGSFGYPQSGPGYGYAPVPGPYQGGPPAPGPGYNYGPSPPVYAHGNGYNNQYNNYGPPPPQIHAPPPGNYGYPNDKPYGYNSNNIPPPPRSNGPSPVPGYAPGPGRSPGHSPRPSMHSVQQPPQPQTSGPRTFVLRQSPQTHKIIDVVPGGAPPDAPAFYSITSSPKTAKADFALARGPDPNDHNALVGTVKSHTFSSKYDLVVRGIQCTLKSSSLGDKYVIEIPQMGVYKWCTDQNEGTSKMWLKDEQKNVLVTYDKSRGPSNLSTWKKFVGGRDRELQFGVPASDFFVEVMILSIYAVKMAKEGALEAAGEIVGALAGA